jgi:hypothetical protein
MIISHMNAVKKSKEKTADQSTRFIEAAKKAEADLSGKEFEKAFKKIVKAEKPGKKPVA